MQLQSRKLPTTESLRSPDGYRVPAMLGNLCRIYKCTSIDLHAPVLHDIELSIIILKSRKLGSRYHIDQSIAKVRSCLP